MFQITDDFCNTEHAHGDYYKPDSISKLRHSKSEPLYSTINICTD